MKVHKDFTIMEKAYTRTFSWLKVPTSAFTFKTLFSVITNLHVNLRFKL